MLRRNLRTLGAVLLFLVAGCGGSRDEISRDLSVELVPRSSVNPSWPVGFYVARSPQEWQTIWQLGPNPATRLPSVDFQRFLVAGISVLTTGVCDELLIVGARELPDALQVRYRVQRYGDYATCQQPPAGPTTLFVLIPALAKPVVFVEAP